MYNSAHNPQKQSNISWFSFAGSNLFHHSVQTNLRSQDKRLLQWGHRLGMLLRWVSKTLSRWTTIRAAHARLMAMDDRLLDDIGLTRSDIEAVISGKVTVGHTPDVRDLQIANPFQQIGKSIRLWVAGSKARAELMAMDDHMLDDIGLTRRDIDAAVNGTLNSSRPSHVHELKIAQPIDASVATNKQRYAA